MLEFNLGNFNNEISSHSKRLFCLDGSFEPCEALNARGYCCSIIHHPIWNYIALGVVLAMSLWVSMPVNGAIHGFSFVPESITFTETIVATTMASLGLLWWICIFFSVFTVDNGVNYGWSDRMMQIGFSITLFAGGCLMMILPACGFSGLLKFAQHTDNAGLLGLVSGGFATGLLSNIRVVDSPMEINERHERLLPFEEEPRQEREYRDSYSASSSDDPLNDIYPRTTVPDNAAGNPERITSEPTPSLSGDSDIGSDKSNDSDGHYCSICLNENGGGWDSELQKETPIEPYEETPCHHWFHTHCLLHWKEHGDFCPACRATLP